MKSNIVTNLSFKQYQKKYKNYKKHLYSFTKQEVLEFDRQADTIGEHYVLNKRRWALIGDTYYEIPKPIRPMWFKGLSAAGKLATCVIPVGVVGALGGAGYGIYYAVTHKVTGIKAELNADASELIEAVNFTKNSDGDLEATIKLKGDHKKSEIDLENSVIKVDGKELEPETDYTFDKSNGKLVIKKSAIKSNNPKIEINLKKKESTTKITTAKFIEYYKKYNDIYKKTENVYTVDQILALYIDDEKMNVTDIIYSKKDSERRASVKYGTGTGKDSSRRIDTDYITVTDIGLKEGEDYCTIDGDGTITYHDTDASSSQYSVLKVNKYGYILEVLKIDGKDGLVKVELKGEPGKPAPVVKKLILEKSSADLGFEKQVSLKISAEGGELPTAGINPTSTNPDVATGMVVYSAEGGATYLQITTKKIEGETTITIVADGFESATCKVTVSDKPAPTTDKEKFLSVYKTYSDNFQKGNTMFNYSDIDITYAGKTAEVNNCIYGIKDGIKSVTLNNVTIAGGALEYNGIVTLIETAEKISGIEIVYDLTGFTTKDADVGVKFLKDGAIVRDYSFNSYGYTKKLSVETVDVNIEYKNSPVDIIKLATENVAMLSDNYMKATSQFIKDQTILDKYCEESVTPTSYDISYATDHGCTYTFSTSDHSNESFRIDINGYKGEILEYLSLPDTGNIEITISPNEGFGYVYDGTSANVKLKNLKIDKFGIINNYKVLRNEVIFSYDMSFTGVPIGEEKQCNFELKDERYECDIKEINSKECLSLQCQIPSDTNINKFKILENSTPINLKVNLYENNLFVFFNDKRCDIEFMQSVSENDIMKITLNGQPLTGGGYLKIIIKLKTNFVEDKAIVYYEG